ncbi:Phosphatidylethanolamine N-methyltransferase [Labeo rohita]|uniref:Phosphatidylethanolamine N-methyltransferase n=1 Tax=Labeo rohita TaxID=84645 RepID=A0ABQ8L9H8_LABRO|nr:Phosphatidylethanolamine N-methyltransferase [Labeo rohita]
MQKELAHRDNKEKKNEECEGKVTAPHGSTNPFDVFISPHVPPPYHHYPVAKLQALKVDPDLNCSPPRKLTATDRKQAAAAGGQEEEDPEMIPKTPNEELEEERTHRLPPPKKRKTRNTVKAENVSITAQWSKFHGLMG